MGGEGGGGPPLGRCRRQQSYRIPYRESYSKPYYNSKSENPPFQEIPPETVESLFWTQSRGREGGEGGVLISSHLWAIPPPAPPRGDAGRRWRWGAE